MSNKVEIWVLVEKHVMKPTLNQKVSQTSIRGKLYLHSKKFEIQYHKFYLIFLHRFFLDVQFDKTDDEY